MTGTRHVGRSRLLAEVIRRSTSAVLVRGATPIDGVDIETPLTGVPVVRDAETVAALLVEVARTGTTLAIDDIDRLPFAVLVPLVEGLRQRTVRFVAVSELSQVLEARDPQRAALLRRLVDDTDAVTVVVPPLTSTETAALGDALRRAEYEAGAAGGAWLTSLHQLSGGNPALVRGVVEAAATAGRFDAPMPILPHTDPVPGTLIDIVRDILEPLEDSDRAALARLDELGAIPTAHLRAILPARVLSRLADHGLLAAASDPGMAAVPGLVGRSALEGVDPEAAGASCADWAARLTRLAQRGARLTSREEAYCARHLADIDRSAGGEAAVVGLLVRGALALASSGAPAEAFAVARRAEAVGAAFAATSATVLARLALGRYEGLEASLEALPAPSDRSERELGLSVISRWLVTAAPPVDDALAWLRRMHDWAPRDAGWVARVASTRALLATMLADSQSVPALPFPSLEGVIDPDDLAFAQACEAVTTAAGGDVARTRALLRHRLETHGLLVEPVMSVFCLQAFAHIVLSIDLDVVQAAVRRRLLSAYWSDRQDHIALLTVMDATVQLMRHRNDEVLAAVQSIRVAVPPPIRVWCDSLRILAYLRRGDVVRAGEALACLDRLPGQRAIPSFAVVREMVRAAFELASSHPQAAAVRALRILPMAERSFPIATATLLRIALAGGVAAPDVLARAGELVGRFDLEPLRRLVDEIRASMSGSSKMSLDRLTARERQVVLLSAAGATNAEIADKLHVSIRTVESHLHHARTRLGMGRHERFSALAATGSPSDDAVSKR